VFGPIILFQSFRVLLKASPHPRFVPITSVGGSMGFMVSDTVDASAYCASKAALNCVTRKIHFEEDWLGTFSVSSQLFAEMLLR
jgi:NAD(P)-dependent dehydrogenase (short-subunit alcohol dehydrogenase family)